MNSLFGRILFWFWLTLAVTIAGSGLISALMINSSERQPFYTRIAEFELKEARHAWETGGEPALAEFMARFHSTFEGPAYFIDGRGKDLLTGQDRSELIRRAGDRRSLALGAAHDDQYWFVHVVARPGTVAWLLWPQHLWMIGAAVLFCYLLAWELTKPLRQIEKAVTRFGQGDFTARARSTRGDELGQLARTFDQMAERIQTLLAAERRLLGDISHELRSPLARLGVAVELARTGEDKEAALNRIEKESDRLNSLVGQLLQVTRAEGDPNWLRPVPVRLDELLGELVDDCSIEASARGSRLTMDPAQPVTVEGDPELLRRAAENVIRNAIRYAPPGTAVEVRLARINGAARVSVRDYGPGVPEDSVERIFNAFYRVETGRDRASGGVGLGLSIARRAVELHRGRIAARNTHPGLMIEIELPVTVHKDDAVAVREPSTVPANPEVR